MNWCRFDPKSRHPNPSSKHEVIASTPTSSLSQSLSLTHTHTRTHTQRHSPFHFFIPHFSCFLSQHLKFYFYFPVTSFFSNYIFLSLYFTFSHILTITLSHTNTQTLPLSLSPKDTFTLSIIFYPFQTFVLPLSLPFFISSLSELSLLRSSVKNRKKEIPGNGNDRLKKYQKIRSSAGFFSSMKFWMNEVNE